MIIICIDSPATGAAVNYISTQGEAHSEQKLPDTANGADYT